ncbi:MAG: hypothetical protein ABUK13_07880 [Gammaproteobacteria bacterium]
MKIDKINSPMRFFFLVAAAVILTGIWLTGFEVVHWLLYIPVIFFSFAAATGFCPGMHLSKMLFGKHS